MRRRWARGGIAIQLLGALLFVLLLVGGVGLLESRRALAARAEAQKALQAALQSAVTSPTQATTFEWYLAQNLRGQPYQASLERRETGEPDPLTGAPLPHPLLTGQLRLPFQFAWLGRGATLTMRLNASIWQEE